MTITLRIIWFVLAVVTAWWILSKIRRLKVKMEDAIFWMFFAAVLLILAIVPELSFKLSELLGFMAPINLVFIVIIFLLVEKIFTLSIIVSQLEEKIGILSAEVALRSKAETKRIDTVDEKEEQLEIENLEMDEIASEIRVPEGKDEIGE